MKSPNPDLANGLRTTFEECLAEGRYGLAIHQAEQLWYASPSLTTAAFINARATPLIEGLEFRHKRVAILRSFTVETMALALETCGLLSRFSIDVRIGQYNAYMQELMNPSAGPADDVDVVLIALHTRTAAPALWDSDDQEEMLSASDWLCENLAAALETYRASLPTPVLLQLLDTPPQDLIDASNTARRSVIAATNARLCEIVTAIPDCHTFSVDDLIEHDGAKWFDERNWKIAKVPFKNSRAPDLANRWFQWTRPLLESPAKVIVTDLDDTLWGGILGEDGFDNLQMKPGSGYRAVQEAMLELKDKGFILSIASKNDETSALSVLASHPDCLVKPDDVVAFRINWSPKSENIRAMSEELNLGLDSFVYLDDNPTERAAVASDLPMVRTLPFMTDPASNARMLKSHPELQRLLVTSEDVARTTYYKARHERSGSIAADPIQRESFLKSLRQEIIYENLTDTVFVRIADLERKTNQFNLCTRRFTESEIRMFADRPDALVVAFSVLDRFGDNGTVGVAIVTQDGETALIENFVMSCRVIGRDIEFDVLRHIAQQTAKHGAKKLVGMFESTAKNTPASQFYETAGFSLLSTDNGVEHWGTALTGDSISKLGKQES